MLTSLFGTSMHVGGIKILMDFIRCDATADELIDVVEGNRTYIPCIYVLNKIDQISIEELDIICKIPHTVPISAHHKWNYDGKSRVVTKCHDNITIFT